MPSKAQKQRGWLLPGQIGGHDTICVKFEIPDTPEYRAATVGLVYELSKWWNWQRTANREAVEAALIFGQLIHETLEFGECEPVVVMNGCRIGEIFAWVGEQAPVGCLPLDGRIVALADYPELGNVVPGEWVNPVGGVTSIILPNLTARALVGADVEGAGGGAAWAAFPIGIARELGSHEHVLTIGEMPAHNHRNPAVNDALFEDISPTGFRDIGRGDSNYLAANVTSVRGNDEPHNNVQPSFTVMWCIVAECIPLEVPRGRPFVLRQNPEDPCLLEQSIDGGVSWTTAFNYALCDLFDNSADLLFIQQQLDAIMQQLEDLIEEYDGTPESITGADGVSQELRDLAICATLEMLVRAPIQAELRRRSRQATFDLLPQFLAVAVSAILAILFPGFGYLILAAAVAAINASISLILTEIQLQVLEDEDAIEELICCLYDALSGGSVPTQGEFQAAGIACQAALTGNAGELSDISAEAMSSTGVYVAFLATIEQLIVEDQLGTYQCPCQPEPEPEPGSYIDPLTFALGEWSHLSRDTAVGGYSGATAGGDWISTQGRDDMGSIRGTFHSASGWREASVVVDLQTNRTVTYASWWRKYPFGGATVDNRVVFYDSAGAVISDSLRSTSSSGSWIKDEFTGPVAGVRFVQFVSRINSNNNVNIDDIRVDYS